MIRLRSDCLEFELSNGEKIPCSAQSVTVELIGSAVETLEPHIVENAAAAVLHYFRDCLKKESVTLSEFTSALEIALRGLGIDVACDTAGSVHHTTHSDLRALAFEAGKAFELGFFNSLRNEVSRCVRQSPTTLKFSGLRGCVKQLAGAQRWSPRCQQLHDQIVDYLRSCLVREQPTRPCDVMVS